MRTGFEGKVCGGDWPHAAPAAQSVTTNARVRIAVSPSLQAFEHRAAALPKSGFAFPRVV
jgi:hypothetical protein